LGIVLADRNLSILEDGREYSVRETAHFLDVVYDVILRYIRDEKLRASKVAIKGLRKEWRIQGKDIKRFLRENG
jgi:hypothetical protein